jgi:hypothetical protein
MTHIPSRLRLATLNMGYWIWSYFVKEDRIQKLEKCLVYALCQVNKVKVLFRVRFLASIVGHLISMYAVFGDTVRQSTRFVYDCVWWKASWQGRVVSTQDALNELSFWDKNCRLLNSKGSTISTMTVNTVFDGVVFCDEATYVINAYHH